MDICVKTTITTVDETVFRFFIALLSVKICDVLLIIAPPSVGLQGFFLWREIGIFELLVRCYQDRKTTQCGPAGKYAKF